MIDQLIGYVMDVARWVIVLILGLVNPAVYSPWTGKVVEVVRADEIRVNRFAKVETVRLYGIDCPIWWPPPKRDEEALDTSQADTPVKDGERSEDAESKNVSPKPYPHGDRAMVYMKERVQGKLVVVQPLPVGISGPWYRPGLRSVDRYGRVLGLVYIDDRLLSDDLLEKGLAWWYKPFVPFERGFKHQEDQAREAKVGLWEYPNPVPPWRWQHTPIEPLHPFQGATPKTDRK
jgi:endonuclease YncB( thermonuclease family)